MSKGCGDIDNNEYINHDRKCYVVIGYSYGYVLNNINYVSYLFCIDVARITVIQINLQNDKTEAIKHILKLLNKASSFEPNVLCMPELWYPKIVTNFENEFMQILHAAKEYNVTLIPGAFLERNCKDDTNNKNNSLCISCPVIAKNGTISGRQLKIHPFGSQRNMVKGGTTVQIFESGDFRFGIGICFPKLLEH